MRENLISVCYYFYTFVALFLMYSTHHNSYFNIHGFFLFYHGFLMISSGTASPWCSRWRRSRSSANWESLWCNSNCRCKVRSYDAIDAFSLCLLLWMFIYNVYACDGGFKIFSLGHNGNGCYFFEKNIRNIVSAFQLQCHHYFKMLCASNSLFLALWDPWKSWYSKNISNEYVHHIAYQKSTFCGSNFRENQSCYNETLINRFIILLFIFI